MLPQTQVMHFVLPMYLASIGFAFTLGAAAGKALSGFAKQAGTASALIGVLQMSGAGVLATLTQPLGLTANAISTAFIAGHTLFVVTGK